MVKPFYSKKIPIFGTNAMLILCLVFFLLPFALRGARLAIDSMKNNVADWLPDDYEETKELKEFRKYFVGDQFVVLSGPWCRENNQTYIKLVRELRQDSLEYEPVLKALKRDEELRAHRKGDELGLMYTGSYHETWGEQREKWLLGKNKQWYWINRRGELYRWDGQNNVIQGFQRFLERSVHGRNKATGVYIDTFGPPPDDEKGIENPFYADPQKLCCRPFKSITTGPEVFEKMAGPNGTLRIGPFGEGDESTFLAKVEAHKRLTGALFGPTPAPTFQWTFESLLQHVDDEAKLAVLRSDDRYRDLFNKYLEKEVNKRFGGARSKLLSANQNVKLEIWYRLWHEAFELEPPPRPTCIIVTLNDPILDELARAVGRPILGKSRGRILEIAIGECGISPNNLHLGGPPADNVAIDEEGTSTLLRLVTLSVIIGIGLAYASFRSFWVTGMLFFVGGVSAISSLSYVWFAGSNLDAILMSMPSLVYVLGLSGAVHIVNYYRDACYENGPELAAETAVAHGWFPCTLAAFTTALGLVSLCTSNLTPIQKFGFFSAIATMATVILLFTYLPSALIIWSPGYKKREGDRDDHSKGLAEHVGNSWNRVGEWVVRHHWAVLTTGLLLMGLFAYGISKVETSVHLLKLFDADAKIIKDYEWMETNLGKLVPMELVVCVDEDVQKEVWLAKQREKARAEINRQRVEEGLPELGPDDEIEFEYDPLEYDLKYSVLERMELSARVRRQTERFFGPEGLDIVGAGMSTDVFAPLQYVDTQIDKGVGIETLANPRWVFNKRLEGKYREILEEDYLAVAGKSNLDYLEAMADKSDPELFGREMWRVSLRLAALNDVDYGDFVADIKSVVEPIMRAYQERTDILEAVQQQIGEDSLTEGRILVLGRNPDNYDPQPVKSVASNDNGHLTTNVDQTYIFANTLQDLLENRGFINRDSKDGKKSQKIYKWLDPNNVDPDLFPTPDMSAEERVKREQVLAKFIGQFEAVVLIEDNPLFDVDFFQSMSRRFIDSRDHIFPVDPETKEPLDGVRTAMQLKREGADVDIGTIYTGIIPIVYKAQNQLLVSLINSIALAFVMIAVVMMLLLRNWGERMTPGNLLNVPGGALAMLPNIFPVLIVFGALGHMGRKVDIGSMMTASVAMGVAVDDTIHFLNWFRAGLARGLSRLDAIRNAYERVATAMTQTTLIGGLGLSAFALSTFTPTQRFGVLMLFLLAAALIGDLILLPAILASPLGRFFGRERRGDGEDDSQTLQSDAGEPDIRVVAPEREAAENGDANDPPNRDYPGPSSRQSTG